MISKRVFIQSSAMAIGSSLLVAPFAQAQSTSRMTWHMPDEGEPHKRTWMAFGASTTVWGRALLPEVQRNLASIANAIAMFEPVSMLVRPEDLALAKQLMPNKVSFVVCPLDDLWLRDSGPVFVKSDRGVAGAVDFNFNGWGEKQDYARDAKVAALVTKQANASRLESDLVLEGGGIEVDGKGTAIITESCVLNANRNPRVSKAECELELQRLLGIQKVIWLPGIKGKDITDGHTDFYARFVRPSVVVAAYDPDPESYDHTVTKQHLAILRQSKDAQGKALEVVVIEAPEQTRKPNVTEFAAGYINFYVCNGAVIAPEFGDTKADLAARRTLEKLFAGRKIVQLNIDGIAAGGGGIHCTTQQEPV